MVTETTEEFEIEDFEFDPFTAGAPRTIAKLIESKYEKSGEEYTAKTKYGRAIPQWKMVFENGLRNDESGAPVIMFQSVNVGYWKKDEDEAFHLVKAGKNSTAVQLADMILDKTGCKLDPNNVDAYINGWFEIIKIKFGEGDYAKSLWVPIEYLGDDVPEEVEKFRDSQAF